MILYLCSFLLTGTLYLSQQDADRARAESSFAEAETLRRQDTAESLRKAVTKYSEALVLWRKLGDAAKEALALNSLGITHRLLSEYGTARQQ
ncbi:MAG: hypothetical protein HY646_20900 [Acidobacteria bacterium]|nr:hypothetical protein [Acidobacteriota bacterium]